MPIKLIKYFQTLHIHINNTKTKSKLNKLTTEPYLIYGDQIAETKKAKKYPHICIHKYCLQYFLVEIKHLIKKPYIICVSKRKNTNRWFKKRLTKSL